MREGLVRAEREARAASPSERMATAARATHTRRKVPLIPGGQLPRGSTAKKRRA
jgi:hypothetical protein